MTATIDVAGIAMPAVGQGLWKIEKQQAAEAVCAAVAAGYRHLPLGALSYVSLDMAAVSALDQNRRFNDPGVFCEQAFNTFYPIYD